MVKRSRLLMQNNQNLKVKTKSRSSYRTNNITYEYNSLLNYLDGYEKQIDEKRKLIHDFQNQLIVISAYTENNPKLKEIKIIEYRKLDKIEGRIINATIYKETNKYIVISQNKKTHNVILKMFFYK